MIKENAPNAIPPPLLHPPELVKKCSGSCMSSFVSLIAKVMSVRNIQGYTQKAAVIWDDPQNVICFLVTLIPPMYLFDLPGDRSKPKI